MENNRKSNKEIWERLTKLETKMEEICKQVLDIKNNDIIHLEKKIDRNSDKIDRIDKRLAYAAGALAALQVLVPLLVHLLTE